MRGPRLALIVDHPLRDLAGIVLTAVELCRRGATCYLVPHNGQNREIWSLAPDFVLLNFARRGCEELADGMAQARIGFGVLDTEGAVWETADSYSELLWTDTPLLDRVQPMCAWGPRMAEHLIDKGIFAPEQICVTGCPRFDFYHPCLRSVLGDENRDAVPRILVNTNFYTVNSRFATPESNMHELRDVLGWNALRAAEVMDRERQAIAGTIAFARALASDFPRARIVLRPHPFEQPQTYLQSLGRFPNVELNTDGPVQRQIHTAAMVIQRSCTTALEAAFAGVPALSPQWIEAPIVVPMAEAVSMPCAHYEELRDAVSAILSPPFVRPPQISAAIARITSDWFHRIDGRAHQRVADAILQATAGLAPHVDRRLCSRYLYGVDGRWRPTSEHVARRARWLLRLRPEWSFRQMRAVPSTFGKRTTKAFSHADVASLVSRIQRASSGRPSRQLSVESVSEIREYAHGFQGRAIRLKSLAAAPLFDTISADPSHERHTA
jgi:surface carbohydrate biosynthesis protein